MLPKKTNGDLNQELNFLISFEGNQFDRTARCWKLSRDVTVQFEWVDDLLADPILTSVVLMLAKLAQSHTAHTVKNTEYRLKKFLSHIHSTQSPVTHISSSDVLNYRSTFDEKREYIFGGLFGFLKTWAQFGYPGINDDVPALLNELVLKGNPHGVAVKTVDPIKGAFSDMEFEALQAALIEGYEQERANLEEFVLVSLILATGRRPVQIGDLKLMDLVEAKTSDGSVEYLLNVPRRKQRAVPWRQEKKPVALIPEIGMAVSGVARAVKTRCKKIAPSLNEECFKLLPLFPDWREVESVLGTRTDIEEIKVLLGSDLLHMKTDNLSKWFSSVIDELSVHSERTNMRLHVFPTRARRTVATRAAREGYGVLTIAEILDHSTTDNAGIYTENVPEHLTAINAAVAMQLAPFAQAFAGVLVDHERDAPRGNDQCSRVRTNEGKVTGSCGRHGFCGALAPIACYTCSAFHALLDGPHEELLQELIDARERVFLTTQDMTMASVNDRTIFAVAEVVERCKARREEMKKNEQNSVLLSQPKGQRSTKAQ